MRPHLKLLDYQKLKHRLKTVRRNRAHSPPSSGVAARMVSVLAAVLLLGWQAGTPAAMALTNTNNNNDTVLTDNTTKEINAKALTDHDCNASEWGFVITQISNENLAPSSIHVIWANGQSANVSLSSFTGMVAHYVTTLNLGSTVTSATANIYSDWSGQFNLSHGPCVEQTGNIVVNKMIDVHGNGVYSSDNSLANELGFRWGLDNETPGRIMGSTANDVSVGTHSITENMVTGFRFTGWFYTYHGENSCNNPVSTHLPEVNVINDQTTSITLCNQFVIHHVKGSITIVKNAIPASTQPFFFTIATATKTNHFTLEDNGHNPSTFPKKSTFSHLKAGVYVVTEASTQGWTLRDITCSEGADIEISGSAVTINLGEGQNVTCKFTNKKNVPVHGRIVVFKRTIPAGDKTKFTITASGTGTIAGNTSRHIKDGQHKTFAVTAGTYNVSEKAVAGWTENTSQCRNLVISAQHPLATCTITNTRTASLTIVKDAQPNSAKVFSFRTTGSGLSNFTLSDNGSNNSKTFTNLIPGNFMVEELAATGWNLSGINCTGGGTFNINGASISLSLAAGNHVTCTFTNKQIPVVLGISTGGRGGGVVLSQVTAAPTPVVSGAQLVNTGNSPLKTILLGVVLLGLLAGATRIAYPSRQR